MTSHARFALAVSAIALVGFSCSRAPKKPDHPIGDAPSTSAAAQKVVPVYKPLDVKLVASGKSISAKPLTAIGENSDASFSVDGQRILFVSRLRPAHRQAQVYELHLGQMTEKRITFNDGNDSGPTYDGDAFLYSSSTDEIKEPGYAVDRLKKTYAPDTLPKESKVGEEGSEIYLQGLTGRSILRLTSQRGFDGDPSYDAGRKQIVFSSSRAQGGATLLYIMSGTERSRVTRQFTQGRFIDRYPHFSPDGKAIVWSRGKIETNATLMQIVMAAGPNLRTIKALVSDRGLNLQPSWNPNGAEIIFSSNRGANGRFNLYTIDLQGQCLRQITDAAFDVLQPVFSPDGKQILFTARHNDALQIFKMDYQAPANCTETLNPVDLSPKPSASPAAASPSATPAVASPTPSATTPSPAPNTTNLGSATEL